MKKMIFLMLMIQLSGMAQDSLFVSNSNVVIKSPYSTIIVPDFSFSVVNATNYVRVRNGDTQVYEGSLSNLWINGANTNTQKIEFLKAINNSNFFTMSVTTATTLSANTYKEVSIMPMNGGSYTLTTSGSSAVTNITTPTNYRSEKGVIVNSITVTPIGGSTIFIGTKK